MNKICSKLVTDYAEWLKNEINISEIKDGCIITTPFLDRHNDYIQLYLLKKEEKYILTDDSYTISDLALSGMKFNSENRINELRMLLHSFGIKNRNDELYVECSQENLPQKKHDLIQALIAINDLYHLAYEKIQNFFLDDVRLFLEKNSIRFTPDLFISGRSGFKHQFDFVIPKSSKKPERFLKAINSPNQNSISSAIFSWQDTKQVRNQNTQAIIFLNDSEKEIPVELREALESYQIANIPWSQRNHYTDDLAA